MEGKTDMPIAVSRYRFIAFSKVTGTPVFHGRALEGVRRLIEQSPIHRAIDYEILDCGDAGEHVFYKYLPLYMVKDKGLGKLAE